MRKGRNSDIIMDEKSTRRFEEALKVKDHVLFYCMDNAWKSEITFIFKNSFYVVPLEGDKSGFTYSVPKYGVKGSNFEYKYDYRVAPLNNQLE